MQARFGAASEVGFAKAQYDEYGNRTGLTPNERMGVGGLGVAALGGAQLNRANNLPKTAASQLQRSVIERRKAERGLKTAQQQRLAATGRRQIKRTAERVTVANTGLAGAKQVENIFRNNLTNVAARQKVIRRFGMGGVAAGGALTALAARNQSRMNQQGEF